MKNKLSRKRTKNLSLRKVLALAAERERAGDPGAAQKLYRQVLRRQPQQADALHGLGILAYRAGRLRLAARYLGEAAAQAPRAAPFHSHLGVVLRALGKTREAVAAHRRALAIDPADPMLHNNIGNALRDQGDLESAERHFREALRLRPDYAQAHVNLANVLRNRGKTEAAEGHFHEAIRLKPESAEAHNDLGNFYLAKGDFDKACRCYRRAVDLNPANVGGHVNLAMALQRLARLEEASLHYRKALELDPNLAQAQLGVGNELLQEGKIEAGVDALRKALTLKPDLSSAYLSLASVPGAGLDKEDISRMMQRLEDPEITDDQRSDLCFALAHWHDKVGNYDDAFAFAETANAIDRKQIGYSAGGNAAFIDRSIATFSRAFFEERRGFGDPSELPVFVVGLARSGTTLVEQIVASHPKAFGAGEVTAIPDLAKALPSMLKTTTPYPDCVALIGREMAARLAGQYLAHLRERGGAARRIIDKLPFNFRSLGLISLLFPSARVIHCRRDPRDVALSCYFIKFLKPISYAYDLAEFGQYYREYERLMAHWRRVLPIDMLEVDYEALVADQEAKSREIVAYCGLEWDDRCLAFHKADRTVRTASSWQVRQPIYSSSTGRWRNYERHLGPLLSSLAEPSSGTFGGDN